MTVGKTHSGKSTFAKALAQHLPDSLIIDQDHHAEFINTHYQALLPKHGPNTIKYAITQTIVDYAVTRTNYHLILCNSNLSRQSRLKVLASFHNRGFISIIVHFNLPDHLLQERIAHSQRSTKIFRTASTFEELLRRQQTESHQEDKTSPMEGEAHHLFVIQNEDEAQPVIRSIVCLVQSM
jgi:predicted kinase